MGSRSTGLARRWSATALVGAGVVLGSTAPAPAADSWWLVSTGDAPPRIVELEPIPGRAEVVAIWLARGAAASQRQTWVYQYGDPHRDPPRPRPLFPELGECWAGADLDVAADGRWAVAAPCMEGTGGEIGGATRKLWLAQLEQDRRVSFQRVDEAPADESIQSVAVRWRDDDSLLLVFARLAGERPELWMRVLGSAQPEAPRRLRVGMDRVRAFHRFRAETLSRGRFVLLHAHRFESGALGWRLATFDAVGEEEDRVDIELDLGIEPVGEPALSTIGDSVFVAWAVRDRGGPASLRLRAWAAGGGLESLGDEWALGAQSEGSHDQPRLTATRQGIWASWRRHTGAGVAIDVARLAQPPGAGRDDTSCSVVEAPSAVEHWLLPGPGGPRVALRHEQPVRVDGLYRWVQIAAASGQHQDECVASRELSAAPPRR